ncbi:MAG: ATP-binding protein [Proteobacteria bacterium]|nr:ATP-binding protein [Pseudomonadota bacterium]
MFKRAPKNMNDTSISVKLTRAIFITSTIVTLVISSVIFLGDYLYERRQIENLYDSGKMSAVNSLLAAITKDDFLQIQLQADGLAFLPGIMHVRIKDLNGEGIATSGDEQKSLVNIRWIRWQIKGAVGGVEKDVGRIELAQDMHFLFKNTAIKAAIFYFGQLIKTLLTLFIFMHLIHRHIVRHLNAVAKHFNSANGPEILGKADLKLNREPENDELQFMVNIINKMHRLIWHRYSDQRQRAINLDNELKRNAEASMSENPVDALSELAGGVAHHINNPLTIIEGYLTIAKKNLQNSDYDRLKVIQLIDTSNRNVARIAHVTKQLIEYASHGTGEPYAKTNIRDVFERLKIGLASFEKQCGMRVKFPDLESLGSFEIVCRKEQITHALTALIKNSLEAVEALDHRWVEIKYERGDAFHDFVISDSGKTLKKILEKNVFTAFYTTKLQHRHLGLGMTLAKGVAESHHGSLSIDDNTENSTVRFLISCALQMTGAPNSSEAVKKEMEKEKEKEMEKEKEIEQNSAA